ncbi:tetratricopeptide repeat domain protein [Candidatus Vecturithrix granuli]|uniref:Tetratricopeptide repeat domain protein n=1 Tax=Vecturithrix granuli TaxID=1499967 RepID=A0A081C1A3_VECG1|nr:tetratricopeptide repeat domain protein [Candidatus Vecturithrix granuli]
MRRFFLMKSLIGVCLLFLLCPLFAEGQGLGGLGGLLQGKNKSKKGGGVSGFADTLGILFEDATTTLGIATQESLLKSYAEAGLKHEQNRTWNDAIVSYKQAIDLLENLRGEIKDSGTKESLVERYLWIYKRLVKLFLQQNSPEDAFAYAERSKARSFLDQLTEAGAGIRKGIDPNLLAEEQQVHRQLQDAWKTLEEKVNAYNASTSLPERAALQPELEGLQRRIGELEQGLASLQRTIRYKNPRYADLKYPEPIGLKEVQNTVLEEGESLLEYFWGEQELHLFLAGCESFQAVTLPVREEEMVSQVDNLLKSAREESESDFPLAHSLYQQLIQPTEPFLQNTHTLLIVPDGALHYLPFEMLVTQPPETQTKGEARYHEAQYLIRRYAVVYAPSASVLKPAILYHAEENEQPAHTFLALAPFTEKLLYEDRTSNLAFLESSENEIKTIGSLFPSSRKYFLGSEAVKAVMFEEAEDYRYVHLATHGLLDSQRPLYSGVAFHDDILRMYEAFNLDLHADLVALSACKTGLGSLKCGEGMVGLTRAFMYAGTPSVLVSLWNVADKSTSVLMIEFYRNLTAGLNKAEALRQAKLTLIDQQGQGGETLRTLVFFGVQQDNREIPVTHAHPFYWAPFVLAGGWR